MACLGLLASAGCGRAPSPASPALSTLPGSTRPPANECRADGSPILAADAEPVGAITAYLNAGGGPQDLAVFLMDLGWAAPRSTFVHRDLDGDGIGEIAVGLSGPPGGIYLWQCRSGTYQAVLALEGRGQPFGPPALEGAVDLTGDGRPELIAFHPQCGAHTCFAQYAVLERNGEGFVDLLRGPTDDLPSPVWSAPPAAPGQPSQISITAEGIGSVGAGPYRRATRTFSWDAARKVFLPQADVIERARYRIHAVHDADAALEAGDGELAIALYEDVIADERLLDWPAPGDGRIALAAYAAYRMIQVHLIASSPDQAWSIFETYLADPPDAGAPFAELARLLLEGYPGGLAAACASVREYARRDPATYLAPLDYGYANRQTSVEDLCLAPPDG